jgi:phage tail-like protein
MKEKEPSLLKYLPAIYRERAERDPLSALLIIVENSFSDIERTIENIDQYFDPFITPIIRNGKDRDFLSWLASWVALSLDEGWDEKKRRRLIKDAAELYKLRGTQKGLKLIIKRFFDIDVDIEEWRWPDEGMVIGRRSSIGMDTHLAEGIEDPDINHCFMVIWEPGDSDLIDPEFIKRIRTGLYGKVESNGLLAEFLGKVKKIRALIDLEKPAHTKCYFHLQLPGEKIEEQMPKILPMIIGVDSTLGNSIIGLCYLGQEEFND